MSDAGLEVVQVEYGERMVNRSVVFHDYAQCGLPDAELHMECNFRVIRDGQTVMLLGASRRSRSRSRCAASSLSRTARARSRIRWWIV
jgi:hypothetical protein